MWIRGSLLLLLGALVPLPCLGMTTDMQLYGQGSAYYLGFIKVYDAFLYTSKRVTATQVLHADVSKCLKLEYAVDLSADDFIQGADTVLTRQYTPDQLSVFQEDIKLIHQGYRDVEEADNYMLCYTANNSKTTLALNGEELVALYSPQFAEVYFGIWLGQRKPLDETLRNALLNQ